MPEPVPLGRPQSGAGVTATIIDIRASSFDAAAGVVTGISAIRLVPDGVQASTSFDWRLPEGPATVSEEEEIRRRLDAFGPVWPELGAYLSGTLVVAHGAAWARTFLRKATLAVGADWAPPSILCTRRMARACFPDLESYGLSALVAALALAPEQPAGGADRCLAVAELYRRCLARIGGSGPGGRAILDAFIAGPAGTADWGGARRQ